MRIGCHKYVYAKPANLPIPLYNNIILVYYTVHVQYYSILYIILLLATAAHDCTTVSGMYCAIRDDYRVVVVYYRVVCSIKQNKQKT